ncbi:sulfotransferase [Rhodobacterales bacterium HKCCE2091]|nr:sulfotransferase [Rhodobacterales bacterium HKCCE2091]
MIDHRYLFIGGLHRSGTSLVARMAGSLPGVASIRGAPVPENEGVYLQGAIPHTARHGMPMHFATDPAQHLVEGCALDRLETGQRLEADWEPWFGPGHWRVEKSPVNLTRMRLMQQLFPLAQFVVVTRHPQAVAAAVSKWVDAPEVALVEHWIAAHDLVRQDMDHLHSVLVLRYEDLVAAPRRTLSVLAAFLDLDALAEPAEPIRDGNLDYRYGDLDAGQAAAMAGWGYAPRGRTEPLDPIVRHPLRAIRERVVAAAASAPD